MSHIADLKAYLLNTLPYATEASGGKFILAKCVFCNDGKNIDSRHMYISVDENEDLPWCYCHICHGTAKLNSDILRTHFGVYDTALLTTNAKYFTKVYNSTRYKSKMLSLNKSYQLKITNSTRDGLAEKKLAYINKRLGSNLSFNDLSNFRIILNISDLLMDNNITEYTRAPGILKELDISFIGFLSTDNAFLNMRNLNQKKYAGNKYLDKRYINYNIFDKDDNTKRFYTVPTQLSAYEKATIHIAEGAFDIISIYLNIYNGMPDRNSAFIGVNGSGFMNVVKHLINGMGLCYLELHIYKDNDMKPHILNHICNCLTPYGIEIYLHENLYEGEKDFGVPKERIQMKTTKLL